MKVLMTGMSPPQCGRPTMTGYEHVSDLWAAALRGGGCEVDHRRVVPNEDLSEYDVALIGLVPANSIAARYMYTAFDVIARARKSGVGLVFYVDDWRFYAVPRGVKVTANHPVERLIKNSMMGKLWYREWGTGEGWSRMVKVLETLRDHKWPATIVPAFTWGKPDLMPSLPTRRQVVLDPSSFSRPYRIEQAAPQDRRRAWVLGTFSDQRQWQERCALTWDTDYIGTRRSKAETRLKEHELVALYGEAWGVLAAPYEHSGSGWWRNRFVYAASGGAVLYSDCREVDGLQGYWQPSAHIERMTASQLVMFADHQRRLMQGSYAPREEVTSAMLTICQEAVDLTQGSTARENEAVA